MSSQRTRLVHLPILTFIFMGVNVGVYLLILGVALYASFAHQPNVLSSVVSVAALNPSSVVNEGAFWTLFTSMFTHVSFTHLLVNMISLFFIGSFVERLIGRRRYFWFYIISGLVAGLAFVLFAYVGTMIPNGDLLFGTINDSAVGASGALFGLGGLLAVLLPRLPVLVFFIVPMPLWAAMAVLLLGLWIASWAAGLPVGNTAHLGGLVVGLLYGWYLRLKYNRKVTQLNRVFSSHGF